MECLKCIIGMGNIYRWTCNHYGRRTPLLVPAHFLAYNMFMNSVDVMYQVLDLPCRK